MAIDFEADAKALAVEDTDLSSVADLAKRAVTIEKELADLELVMKERKEELRDLTENRIPEALREMGLSSFKMADGSFVDVKPYYSASIPADRKGEAFEWLRQHGYDDIIKNTVSVQFGRGEDMEAGKAIDAIRQLGHMPDQAEKIEPMTLKAWVREMVEQGVEFPSELFGAYVGLKAKIKSA